MPDEFYARTVHTVDELLDNGLCIREIVIDDGTELMTGMFMFINGEELRIIRDNAIEHYSPSALDMYLRDQNV
jgi:hypothetical protein